MTEQKIIKKINKNLIITILFIAAFILSYISFTISRYFIITPKEFIGFIISFFHPIEPFWDESVIMFNYRVQLPRIILAFLVGSSLAVSGAAYQGIFKNPMASPDILGASGGAAFGAALAIVNDKSNLVITLYAFCFSVIGVTLVYLVSKKANGDEIMTLVLSGIMISSLFTGATTYIKFTADPLSQLPSIEAWLMGSFNLRFWRETKTAIIPILLGLIPLLLLRWKMNILTLGDDEAKAIGIHPNRLRLIIIIFSTLATSASIAVCGKIGWVGLVIPHLARHIIGSDYKYLLPTSMALSTIFLLVLDFIAQNAGGAVLPLGVLNAFVGAPFFIYLITTTGKK